MKRFIDHDLEQWRNSRRRKPLILRGARQVGKTYSVRRFGETRFDNFVLVDLERNLVWHKVFEGNLQARQICSDLEILVKSAPQHIHTRTGAAQPRFKGREVARYQIRGLKYGLFSRLAFQTSAFLPCILFKIC